jgi:hypothetical protein
MFYNLSHSGQYYKTILGIIYETRGIFPYDFDWGYANSDVITLKKSFITLATVANIIKFLGVIYANSSVFP